MPKSNQNFKLKELLHSFSSKKNKPPYSVIVATDYFVNYLQELKKANFVNNISFHNNYDKRWVNLAEEGVIRLFYNPNEPDPLGIRGVTLPDKLVEQLPSNVQKRLLANTIGEFEGFTTEGKRAVDNSGLIEYRALESILDSTEGAVYVPFEIAKDVFQMVSDSKNPETIVTFIKDYTNSNNITPHDLSATIKNNITNLPRLSRKYFTQP